MRFYLCAFIAGFLIFSSTVSAAMTSTNFEIPFDSINSGGTDNSTSTNFLLYDTLGEQATGYTTSTNYTVQAGYRQTEFFEPTLSFSISAQENNTQTSYTALSKSPTTVTVSSVANFSVGQYIGVVENLGFSQNFIVGRITEINGLILTVDKWDGMVSAISITPAGGDDYVYRMEDNNADFGQLDVNLGKTTIVRTNISTNAASGYTLRVQTDDYLRASPSAHIKNVSDGSVTLGSEEYGAQVYGYTATSTGFDFAATSTLRDIQISTTTADNDRIGMFYKISITPVTPAGAYTQTIRYLLTANF